MSQSIKDLKKLQNLYMCCVLNLSFTTNCMVTYPDKVEGSPLCEIYMSVAFLMPDLAFIVLFDRGNLPVRLPEY